MSEPRFQGRPEDPFGILRRVMQPRRRPAAGEACEMCGESVPTEHNHVASITERRLLCACRACYLLFTRPGAGGRRLRAVPERYRAPTSFAFSDAQWDELAIPVGLAFFFRQSDPDDPEAPPAAVAYYPSPAGATESLLDLGAWLEISAANPELADVEADVEAVLVRRRGPGVFTCLIVPIDACYHLVGLVRQHWTGLQGGDEVWERIEAYLAELERRAAGTRAG